MLRQEKKRDSDDKDIIISIGSFNSVDTDPIDLFINGRRKFNNKWDLDQVLYEYSDYNYQELIGIPNVVRVLNGFRFEELISKEDGKRLLLEIYSRLRREGWL